MEIATSQLPRVLRPALIGLGTAFAWIVLVMLLGLGAGNAHADDTDDKGLLGAVTSTVGHTAPIITSTVTGTVKTVADDANGVVDTVVAVAPAPVQTPVREVASTVGAVVTIATAPVSELVSGGVVGAVAAPVVDLVAQVPVVGEVVSSVGLDDAVTDLSGTVDDALGAVTRVIDDSGSTILQPPVGGAPPPALPVPATASSGQTGITDFGVEDPSTSASTSASADVQTTQAAASHRFSFASLPAAEAGSTATSADVFTPDPAGGTPGPAGGLCLPASSTGSSGAGPGAWALVALGPPAAHRAWVHRAGLEDEHAPPAPAGSTDVSPD